MSGWKIVIEGDNAPASDEEFESLRRLARNMTKAAEVTFPGDVKHVTATPAQGTEEIGVTDREQTDNADKQEAAKAEREQKKVEEANAAAEKRDKELASERAKAADKSK